MELQEKLISSFMVMENLGKVDLDSSIHDIRTKAMASFEKEGFPTKKDEEWKYTSLKSVLNHDYSVFPKEESDIELESDSESDIENVEL